jgi:DNA-binding SARP family transcriptional activator
MSTLECRPVAVLRVGLLEEFSATYMEGRLELGRCARRLVAYLALRNAWTPRSTVAAALWPDSEPAQGLSTLRAALVRLPHPDGTLLVEKAGEHLRLHPAVTVDVREVARLARQVLQAATPVEADDLEALCARSELLPDWPEEWVVVDREQLRELRLHALETVAASLTAAGRTAQAIQAALAAVQAEPLRESAARALVKVYLAEGNWCEAIRHYRAYARVIRRELGLEPSPQMQALVQEIWPRAQRPLPALVEAKAG